MLEVLFKNYPWLNEIALLREQNRGRTVTK